MPARPRFDLELLEGRITPVSFGSPYDYGVGGNAQAVAAGDINGDGSLDLAVSTAEGMTTFLNNGAGLMTNPTGIGGGFGAIELRDMDGDGKRDIVCSDGTAATFRILRGNGDGTFQSALIYPSVSTVQGLDVDDLNGDGRLDVVCSIPGGIVIRLNDGSANILGASTFYGASPVPDGLEVVLGDMNGDGRPDVIQAGYSSNRVYVFLNNGDGTLVTATSYPVGAGTHSSSVAVTDFNRDGKLDVATTIPGNATVGILLGNGDGTLGALNTFASPSAGTLTTADFDLDGNPDLAVNSFGGSRVYVYPGDGAGGFATPVEAGAGINPSGILAADINGDGLPDIITTGTTSPGSVVIALNTTTVSNFPPVITSNGGGSTASVSVAENTTAVTTVTATDVTVPPQTLTYSISGGADAAKFAINGSTGALTFLTAPNFENPTDSGANNVYNVAVRVSDGAGGIDTQAIAVIVTNVNEAPVITSNGGGATAAVSVAENTTAVTTVTATDPDLPAQTLTYSISGGADAAHFAINSSTGVLTFLVAPNFENPGGSGADRNVYDVVVQVSDGSATDTQAIAVTVANVNEPAVIGGTSTGSVTEDSTLVTSNALTIGDPDAGQSVFQTPPNLAGLYGTFTFNPTTFAWGYTLNNGLPVVQALNAGQTLTDTLTVMSLDGTATRVLTITINGAAEPVPPALPPSAPPYYTNAVVFGNLLVLQGNGVPGGTALVPVSSGSFAMFTDMNGDGKGDVVLFLPGLVLLIDGQTGRFLAFAADTNGDSFMDVLLFNSDGTTTTIDGRTGRRN